MLEHMREHAFTADTSSYLEDGRVGPAAVAQLFRAAARLHAVAPWRIVEDGDVVRVDVPELGVTGAALSVIGALGESFGFLLFPSNAGYDAFVEAADEGDPGARDLGTTWHTLELVGVRELPPTMREEAASHGWEVAAASAYPVPSHHDRDGMPRPLTERDVRLLAACAEALSAFVTTHADSFAGEDHFRAEETLVTQAAGPVRLTVPHHGAADLHALDARLREAIAAHADPRLGDARDQAVHDVFRDPELAVELLVSWCVYMLAPGGKTLAASYLTEQGARLPADERVWLEAQGRAWLAPWEVEEVAPAASLTLKDLLTGERRIVVEVVASRMLRPGHAVLARVVDHPDGRSVLCGLHPRALPVREAAEVARVTRGKLRVKGAVPPARLANDAASRDLIRRWEVAVALVPGGVGAPR